MADKDGSLIVEILDVYGDRIDDTADILLSHQVLSDRRIARQVDTSKKIKISNLYGVPQGLYRLEVDPLGYMPVSQFVTIQSSAPTSLQLTCPVEPKKVTKVDFPAYDDLTQSARTILEASATVLGFEHKSGPDLYSALDDVRKAGLLNIIAKCSHTQLASGALVVGSIQQLNECRGDRFFCKVTQQLREDTKNSVASGLFFPAPELLHHPPSGFSSADSFKTFDHYGNLQLSFFTDSRDWVADIDIDDANGLEHVFQVMRNAIENRPTHPYDIHEILVGFQKIDPKYRLIV